MAPPIATAAFSGFGPSVVIAPTVGATFVTVTVVEAVAEKPLALVTLTPTGNEPSRPTLVNAGAATVASSYSPSSSRSHAYVSGPSPPGVEVLASSVRSVPSGVLYG